MIDATVPTVAFILANAFWGLRTGIWAALGAALLVFALRLVRHESVQQAVSGLLGVGIAVAIAAASGQARDFFVIGILRNAAIGVVLLASIPVRRPLVGVIAEFLAPSHLGAMATHSLPGLRSRFPRVAADAASTATDGREPDPEPERGWRDDPRMLRAYTWLTVLWGATFAVRAVVAWLLYRQGDVPAPGTVSLAPGPPGTPVESVVTPWGISRPPPPPRPPPRQGGRGPPRRRWPAVEIGVPLGVISRLHRHRCPDPVQGGRAPPRES